MGTRTALTSNRWITLAVLFALIWTVVIWLEVYNAMDWSGLVGLNYIGPSVVSGIVGLVVMAGLFALLVALYGELGETGPGPDPWPPEER